MSSETNLSQVTSSFYVAEIEQLPLLFHKISGEVSSINSGAALLIKLAQSGLSEEEIIEEVSRAHSVSKNQIRKHIDELCSDLANVRLPEPEETEDESMPLDDFIPAKDTGSGTERYKTLFYKIANRVFKISYPDERSFDLCQALLGGMTSSDSQKPDIEFDLSEGENGWAIFIDGRIQFAMKDSSSFADYIRTAILDTIGTGFSNWIGLHAAGIINQSDQAILFAAPSGSGKSTLSVELVLTGYGYLGDDSQILDLDKQEIWGFPTAANLKPGAWDLFSKKLPELDSISTFRADSRPVKFLPIALDLDKVNKAYKAKALVFPKYSENAKNDLVKVDLAERIRLLSDSGCYSKVEASAEMSQTYIEYVLSLEAYRLEYSSSRNAIQLLKSANLL